MTEKITSSEMTIDTLAGILKASVKKDVVKVKLTDPKNIKWNLCLMIDKCPYKLNFVNTGVPHVIHFVKDIEKVDVKNLGKTLEAPSSGTCWRHTLATKRPNSTLDRCTPMVRAQRRTTPSP